MNEENTAKLAQWAAKLGRSVEELTAQYNEIEASFRQSIAAKDDAWYESAAIRRLFVLIKAELTSPARPFDYISLGFSGTMDVTSRDREEKLAKYSNPETRDKTLAEGLVQVIDGVPTAIDTREYMVAPNPASGNKGFKNRNFGKPLVPVLLRTLVGYGRPSKGGDYKLLSVMETGDLTKMVPPIGQSLRTRYNLREEKTYRYDCNASRLMKFDPIELPEYPKVDDKVICDLLMNAPLFSPETSAGIRVTLKDLRAWHDKHENDGRRLCIVVGDVTVRPPEPVSTGNYIVVIEDTEAMDLSAEGTPLWVPGELERQLDFAPGSKVVAIGRTNIGPGRDPDTGQFDASIERVQLNVAAIFAVPEFRIPPERLDEYLEG